MSPQKSAVAIFDPRRSLALVFQFFSLLLWLWVCLSLHPFLSLRLFVALCLCFLIDISVQCLQEVINAESNESKSKLPHF